jgi:hypothetical protein
MDTETRQLITRIMKFVIFQPNLKIFDIPVMCKNIYTQTK